MSELTSPRLFVHIWAFAHWFDIWSEILEVITRASFPDPVHIGLIGQPADLREALALAGAHGVRVHGHLHSRNRHECDTLRLLWAAARDTEGPLFYAHTKGLSKPSPTYTKWRWFMLHAVGVEWRLRIEELKTHDVVGCCWHPQKGWIAGNYWAARADYIRRLPAPQWTGDRLDNERWVLRATPPPRIKSLIDTGGEPCEEAWHVRMGQPHRRFIRWRTASSYANGTLQ